MAIIAISRQVAALGDEISTALAEEIGYDATGKKTKNNELEVIGEELKKFIINLISK